MITVTIGDVLDNKLDCRGTEANLYVVRDGPTVFYVGQSINPVNRLWQHLGEYWPYTISSLGQLIKANLPDSRAWQVELLTPAEANPDGGRVIRGDEKYAIDWAEQCLIYTYAPICNVMHKTRPSEPLPEQYVDPHPRIANEGVLLD